MVLTVSFMLSLVIGLFVTIPARCGASSTDLISASRHQDHTTSPSAFDAFVVCTERVHRIPLPTFVTTAKRPSFENGTASILRLICRRDQLRRIGTTGKSGEVAKNVAVKHFR